MVHGLTCLPYAAEDVEQAELLDAGEHLGDASADDIGPGDLIHSLAGGIEVHGR